MCFSIQSMSTCDIEQMVEKELEQRTEKGHNMNLHIWRASFEWDP